MDVKIYKFAEFELDLAESELRNGKSSVPLQEKPLQLLCALLDHPQRVVTREQLRDRMWDSRTVVNFEQGINVAIKKVRSALGDTAENPRFIETVAKKGYRFLAPVEVMWRADAPPLNLPAQPIPEIGVRTDTGTLRARDGRTLRAAIVAGICCLAGAGIVTVLLGGRPKPSFHSLAVLPLQNLSPDAGQDYLADGITEELTTSLAETLPLRVISRTSVMPYKQTNKSIQQIARELGVDAIVEGSVARAGNQVSVTVQLIDPGVDRHLWAQRYERRPEDLLAMESEVAQAIALRVNSTLSPAQRPRVTAHSVDPGVYDLWLMGRYHWNRRTMADFAQAKSYFEQAAARDPGYAPAYAGLAEVLALSTQYGAVSFEDALPRASAAATHAVELDDNLAEAHAILGFIELAGRRWRPSEAEFRRALAIDPSLAEAHHWIAYLLFFLDRRDEAVAEIAKARALDPLSAVTNADEGHFLYAMRDFDKARVRLRRAIEIAPDLGQSHETLALVDLETGHLADAQREARTGLAFDPNNPRTLGEAGYVLASSGATTDAQGLLSTLLNMMQQGSSGASFPALVEIALGQPDRALELLEQSPALRTYNIRALGQWHGFEKLIPDARYQKLLADDP